MRRKVSQAFLNASHRKKFENHWATVFNPVTSDKTNMPRRKVPRLLPSSKRLWPGEGNFNDRDEGHKNVSWLLKATCFFHVAVRELYLDKGERINL